jgi:ComF family protein
MPLMTSFFQSLVDFALPPRCPACSEIVTTQNSFCLSCWQTLTFLGEGGCERCGIPLSTFDQTCGACLLKPPIHDGVRGIVAYGEVARHVVLKFKYGGRLGLARVLAQRMGPIIREFPDAVLVPVPLHRWRIWKRGFNQSAQIAKILGAEHGHDVLLNALIRHRQTEPLGTLSARQRSKVVTGAFSINTAHLNAIKDRTIILIDDVYTTGTTTTACTKVLKHAGARAVRILCWARVIPET